MLSALWTCAAYVLCRAIIPFDDDGDDGDHGNAYGHDGDNDGGDDFVGMAERRRRGDNNKVVTFEESSTVCSVDLCRGCHVQDDNDDAAEDDDDEDDAEMFRKK